MKKILYGMMAATMIFATSCENELELGAAGEESMVSFTISTPDMGSRASEYDYSDGTTATVLQYAVYDANGAYLSELTGTQNINLTTTVEFKLTTGNEYTVVFWADNAEAPYTVDFANKTMTANYSNVVSNNEKLDAFYLAKKIKVTGAANEKAELKRPFAQLNIGTNDYEASRKAGYTPTNSAVTVKQVYTTLNLMDGSVDVDSKVDAVFAESAIDRNQTFPVANCEYIAMNYLLVGADKETVDVEFTYTDGSDAKTRKVGSVPVQRNYRTNIYGQLLTSDVDVNVEIKPGFDGVTEEITNIVNNLNELQAALDAAPTGATTTIYLGKDIEGNVTEIQKPGRKIIIEGGNNVFKGAIKVHSNSNYYADAALTIKNLNFETSTASINCIEALENGSERYSTNITVEGCTFKATDAAVNTSVGIQVKATRGVTVKNCTATNMHSLIQAQSCDTGDVKVVNCTVNGKNGVAFKQVKAATVEGTTIVAAEYGIRFDGNIDNYGITVKENTVTAAQPFIVRKMTGANNTITLEGDNTLTVSTSRADASKPYQIIITNGSDDEAYVKPTGTYTLTGAEGYLVYPRDVFVSSWDEFTAALADNATIILSSDITYDANYQLQKAVTIDLNGKAMTLPMINIHTKSTVKNGTINGKVYARKNSEIVFDKITFSGAVADNLSTEGHLAIQGGCKSLYAKDCLFSPTSVTGTQTKPLSFEGGSSDMKFENCEFKSSPYKKQVYLYSLSATGSLDFINCNFNNKTPNIMFAAACPLTNLKMNGTTKLSSVTLEINRAKDAVTAEDLAYLRESLIANNSFSSVRLFYAGGSSEYIR